MPNIQLSHRPVKDGALKLNSFLQETSIVFTSLFENFWRPDPLAYILRVASSEFLSFSILILIFLHFHGDIFFGRVKREERDRGNSFNRHYWIPLFVTNLKNSNEYLIVRNITKFNDPYLSTATINIFWEILATSMLEAKASLRVFMHKHNVKKISKLNLIS